MKQLRDDEWKCFGTATTFINYKFLKERSDRTKEPMMVIINNLVEKLRLSEVPNEN